MLLEIQRYFIPIDSIKFRTRGIFPKYLIYFQHYYDYSIFSATSLEIIFWQ